MTEKKKINWLLILQGWAMLWVVIGHAFIGDINNQASWPGWERALMGIAYSFHMPLFMLISGWLFYCTRLKTNNLNKNGGHRWSYGSIIKDKALRILLPGLFFSIIAFAIKTAFPGEVSRQAGLSLHDIAMAYLYPYANPLRELWFIAALFWMFVLTPLWRWVLQKKWTMWAMVVVLLAIHFLELDIKFLSIDRLCLHAIWFYLGLVISKEEIVDNLFNRYPWITLFAGLAVYLVGLFVVSALLKTVGGIVFSFGLALLADKDVPKLFFSFRNYTYQIFLMGIFAQMFVKIMYKHVSMPYVGAYLLCIVFGLYVPVLVSKVIEKINWKPLKMCLGLK